jgi:hypothetical protein
MLKRLTIQYERGPGAIDLFGCENPRFGRLQTKCGEFSNLKLPHHEGLNSLSRNDELSSECSRLWRASV